MELNVIICVFLCSFFIIFPVHGRYLVDGYTQDRHFHEERQTNSSENCTLAMFGGDQYAYMSCTAEYALQRNWFPSPISGLFSYQVWNGFDGFWQNGAVLETLVNFMEYAGHRRYKTVVTSSLRDISSLVEAYYPQPSYDDMGWYGLSYIRIYEVLGGEDFLQRARDIFDWNWRNGWDSTGACSGGLWFDQGMTFKATITNVQMLHLGAKLYLLTGQNDTGLLIKVRKVWSFITNTKIIDPRTYQVADGIHLENCTRNDNMGPTYSPGVLAGGLVHLSKITKDPHLLDLAHKIVNATIKYHSQDGVLTEDCDFDGCGDDNKVFKGIFVRNLRYLMAESDSNTREYYSQFLRHNVDVLMKNSSCEDVLQCKLVYRDGPSYHGPTTPVFSTNWHGPFNYSAPMQQASALDLLASTIEPGTQCSGPGCAYDPPIPPPMTLTCKNDPCPKGQDCCEYEDDYRTCCNSDQKCVDGYCE